MILLTTRTHPPSERVYILAQAVSGSPLCWFGVERRYKPEGLRSWELSRRSRTNSLARSDDHASVGGIDPEVVLAELDESTGRRIVEEQGMNVFHDMEDATMMD